MNTSQAPRTLNLSLNENKYQSQFYTSEADKLIRKLKAEEDLKTYRDSKRTPVFNIRRKQTKEQKQQQKQQQKIIKQQQKQQQKEEIKKINIEFKQKQKQQKQQQKQIKKQQKKQAKQEQIITNDEKIKILENMRDNIKNSNEIKNFYEVDIKYFPVIDIQLFETIEKYNEYLKRSGDEALKNIETMKRNKITYPDSETKELILSLFYNIYKKYKNTDVIFIYINKNIDTTKKIKNKKEELKKEEENLKKIKFFKNDKELKKEMDKFDDLDKKGLIFEKNNTNKRMYEDNLNKIKKLKRNIDELNNNILFSDTIELSKEESFSKWWKVFSKFGANIFYSLSEADGYEQYLKYKDIKNDFLTYIIELEGKIAIYPIKENKNENKIFIKQNFKEHTFSNCLLEPIKQWAIDSKNEAKSKPAFYRYRGIEEKINIYIDKYLNDGVPQDEIINICNDLQIDIEISLPLQENKLLDCKSTKKALKKFCFINTKFNHIEHNELILKNNFITTYLNKDGFKENLTSDQLSNIKSELDENNDFYMYKRNKGKISSIITLKGNYKCINEYNEFVKIFERETGLEYCKICDVEDYELSSFIRNGCHYNTSLNFIDSLAENKKFNDISHIDMTKAYANFKSCQFYNGFLGKITDFRKTNKIMGVGMYQINNIDFSNVEEKMKRILLKLNVYKDNYIYPSPELKFLEDNNITFDIIAGAWGHSPLEFKFNNFMLDKKDDGVPYYAKWCGGANSYYFNDNYILKSSKEYADILKYNIEEYQNITHISQTEETIISIKKKNNFHLSHITAFIVSYQRLNLIEQLKEINYNNLIRVNVDCIYYYKSNDEIILKNVFRHKEFKECILNLTGGSLIPLVDNYLKKYNYSNIEVDDNYKSKINLGCGGSGKTTKELRDTGLIKKLFVPPSWKLARNKEREENINCSVWHYITTSDAEILSKILKKYNVLIIDEVSMMTDETKNIILDKFKLCKIIFCGDLGYQLPPWKGEEMTTEFIDKIEYFKNNYRCKCPLLLELLNKCREMINNNKTLDYINKYIIDFFEKNNRIINLEKLKEIYDINDMILSGTNVLKDYYSKLFIGKFDTKKLYITSNSRQYSNGEIVITNDEIKGVKYEERYCYTTHSIQGETAYDKLFIDVSKMFDERMFYTALSRAMYIDQIYLISN
jgi:hypothetical protein